MRVLCSIVFVCMFMSLPVHSESRISGNIDNITFDPANNPYVVEKDIVVPAGKEVGIPAGTIFLFNSFTGLHVQGNLRVLGTTEAPVIFTSIFDSKYNPASTQLPNPFDWNGILVTGASVGSYFNNFQLSFSVYGIKSQSQNVVIQNGVFHQNGQFHFTIHDQIQFVQDNIPYSYGEGAAEAASSSGGKSAKKSQKVKGGKESRKTKIVRFSCLGVGIAGAGVGTYFVIRAKDRKENADLLQSQLEAGTAPIDGNDLWDVQDAKRTQSTVGAIVSYGVSLLGFVGFGVSFAF